MASDSRLLEDEINAEMRVLLRPKRPPRPQSEAFLLDRVASSAAGSAQTRHQVGRGTDPSKRKSKRYSAFGVSPSLHTNTLYSLCNTYDAL